jgi:hypothetical protein
MTTAATLLPMLAEVAALALHEAEALTIDREKARAVILASLRANFPALLSEFDRLDAEARSDTDKLPPSEEK